MRKKLAKVPAPEKIFTSIEEVRSLYFHTPEEIVAKVKKSNQARGVDLSFFEINSIDKGEPSTLS